MITVKLFKDLKVRRISQTRDIAFNENEEVVGVWDWEDSAVSLVGIDAVAIYLDGVWSVSYPVAK